MGDIKKKTNADISSKKLKIKNKKEVAKVLTKNKHTMVTAKKSSNVRKKPVVKKVVKPVIIDEELENVTIVKEEAKPRSIKAPKEDVKKAKKPSTTKKSEEPKKIVYKKENKPKQEEKVETETKTKVEKKPKEEKKVAVKIKDKSNNEEKADEEKDVKSVIKPKEEEHVTIKKENDKKEIKSIKVEDIKNIKKRAEKQKPNDLKQTKKKNTGTKKDDVKKVKSVYDPEKNRWVIKEDKDQIKKDKKAKRAEKKALKKSKREVIEERESYLTDTQFRGLKSKFIEEVYVESYKEETKKNAKKASKKLLIFIVICIIIGAFLLFGFKIYKEKIKERLNMYPKYVIGDEVKLKDDSTWYVLEDTDGSQANVVLLYPNMLDVNEDGKIAKEDAKQYSKNTIKFDVKDETGIAYYLNNEYKKKLEAKVGDVVEVSIMSTKQFVDMRDRFNFGYQWKDGNILAKAGGSHYWILSERNNKVYVVKTDGTFFLDNITSTRYIRPVITINKDLVTKIDKTKTEEKKEK